MVFNYKPQKQKVLTLDKLRQQILSLLGFYLLLVIVRMFTFLPFLPYNLVVKTKKLSSMTFFYHVFPTFWPLHQQVECQCKRQPSLSSRIGFSEWVRTQGFFAAGTGGKFFCFYYLLSFFSPSFINLPPFELWCFPAGWTLVFCWRCCWFLLKFPPVDLCRR